MPRRPRGEGARAAPHVAMSASFRSASTRSRSSARTSRPCIATRAPVARRMAAAAPRWSACRCVTATSDTSSRFRPILASPSRSSESPPSADHPGSITASEPSDPSTTYTRVASGTPNRNGTARVQMPGRTCSTGGRTPSRSAAACTGLIGSGAGAAGGGTVVTPATLPTRVWPSTALLPTDGEQKWSGAGRGPDHFCSPSARAGRGTGLQADGAGRADSPADARE